MRMVLVSILLFMGWSNALAQTVLETDAFRLVVSETGCWQSLVELRTGRELCDAGAKLPLASATILGKSAGATGGRSNGDALEVVFGGTGTTVTYRVERAADWIRFTLARVDGPRPERLTLVQVPVALTANVGRRLDLAWDERTSVCLLAGSQQTDCAAAAKQDHTLLAATTQDAPGPKLEGASAALIVCPTPRIREVLRRASNEFGLLTNEKDGVPAKDTDAARGSYWFVSLGEADADRMIDYCGRAGIEQVLLGSGSWCRSVGHYLFDEHRFPDGRESLKRLVDKLHARGILVGMHTFVSKVSKIDPYVTPVPDRRFWVDREATLAGDIQADLTELRCATSLREWPGSPVASQKFWEGGVTKHQEAILDDEIVQYQSIGPEGKWDTFLGCKRGAWGTTAAAHVADTRVRHYGVDGCINGYIVDQETDLLDEATTRIADILNYCGFDMVYFDGGEDVPKTRFNYYVSKFQEAAVRKFEKRPLLHMGTIMTHLLWHSFARSSTVDTYLNTLHGAILSGQTLDKWPTVRSHIDHSIRYMLSCRQDLMPGELGWFGIWPKGQNTDGLQLDEAEYLMVKSLAYDAPISLQTSFGQLEAHPLTPQILGIVKAYEGLRMKRLVPVEQREPLMELDKDFILLRAGGTAEFVPVAPVKSVGGGRDVRAMVGRYGAGAIATLWHYVKDGTVTLNVDLAKLRVTDFEGEPVPFAETADAVTLAVDSRRLTLFFDGLTQEQVVALLTTASVATRQPAYVWIRAQDCRRLAGEMALGSSVGVKEAEAFGDVLVCTGAPSPQRPEEWFAEYSVDLPHEGLWTLWARVRYPSGTDDSFAVLWPGQQLTLGPDQVLGNCGVNEKRWHWTGRGGGSTTVPPGQPLTVTLPKGKTTFRVYAREGRGTAASNPRLDLLGLTDDAGAVPTDGEARALLTGAPSEPGR